MNNDYDQDGCLDGDIYDGNNIVAFGEDTDDDFDGVFDPNDACDPDEEICKEDIKNMGSLRYATFIIYLNDNFTGGETEFPKHNFKAKPKIGKGVLFFNLNDNNTYRRDNSFHGGLPPIVGEKWMCNKWIRLKPIK